MTPSKFSRRPSVRALVSAGLLSAVPAAAQVAAEVQPLVEVSEPAIDTTEAQFIPERGVPGNPLRGLTAEELAKFEQGLALFQHEFTPAEGLGPLFNRQACSTCHFSPTIGGSDPTGAENVTHYTIRSGDQFHQAFEVGGPVQQLRSIKELGGACQLEPDHVPVNQPGVGRSIRHTGPLYGFGLLDAVPDATLRSWEGKKPWKAPGVLGVANWGSELEGLGKLVAFHLDGTRTQPIGAPRVGRFGWHAATPTLFHFTSDPFNIELGVSTPFFPRENTPDGSQPPEECRLPGQQPNDTNSQMTLQLYYFQAFLAAPERGPITPQVLKGHLAFRKAHCHDCHRERMKTDDYYAPWPDGTAHKVAALSNKWIAPYSDLLLHDMGPELEDVRPQGRASGRFWRTTPLWGLRFKTRFLHDGSANTVEDSILMHGGEGKWSRDAYLKMTAQERLDMKAFLDSL